MTTRTTIHCDGCDKTVGADDPRRLCDAPWLELDLNAAPYVSRNFHSEKCLSDWLLGRLAKRG